jgi:hypothetical protein
MVCPNAKRTGPATEVVGPFAFPDNVTGILREIVAGGRNLRVVVVAEPDSRTVTAANTRAASTSNAATAFPQATEIGHTLLNCYGLSRSPIAHIEVDLGL